MPDTLAGAGMFPWAGAGTVMPKKCLFIINGLGLGNSTRCYAIIEQLRRRCPEVEIHVLTSGNGLEFFRDKPEIASLTPMANFFYSVKNNQISAWRTLLSAGRLARLAMIKNRQVAEALRRIQPQAVVTDSEYNVRPARRQGIPVLAVNNSDVVVSEFFRRQDKPFSIMGQFWLVEFMDYLFHRFFVDAVISPAPARLPARHRRVRRVGLILRDEVRRMAPAPAPFRNPRALREMLCMLGGSTLGTRKNLLFHDLPYRVAVIGRAVLATGQVRYHGPADVQHPAPGASRPAGGERRLQRRQRGPGVEQADPGDPRAAACGAICQRHAGAVGARRSDHGKRGDRTHQGIMRNRRLERIRAVPARSCAWTARRKPRKSSWNTYDHLRR